MTDHTEAARDLMARIRYQVFRPEVTTTGPCPRCGAGSRGSMTCADCLVFDLGRIVGGVAALRYVNCCIRQREAEKSVLRRAGDGGG